MPTSGLGQRNARAGSMSHPSEGRPYEASMKSMKQCEGQPWERKGPYFVSALQMMRMTTVGINEQGNRA